MQRHRQVAANHEPFHFTSSLVNLRSMSCMLAAVASCCLSFVAPMTVVWSICHIGHIQYSPCARCRSSCHAPEHAASSANASQQLHCFQHPCRCGGAYVISEGVTNVLDGIGGGASIGLLSPDGWREAVQLTVKRPCMTVLLAVQTSFQRNRMRC